MAIILAEDEVNWGRRAFPEAQKLLAGVPIETLDPYVEVGWYDSRVHEESGSFAVVREDGAHAGLVGAVLRVSYGSRASFVYVVDFADVPEDLSLYRRAFLSLTLLTREHVPCIVEVVA